jgi:hypothetical protein
VTDKVDLRTPFPAKAIGKLPKITCPACSKSQKKVCDDHKKAKCRTCKNYITSEHWHADFVGHAHVTERLLDVDPEWTWEPVSFQSNGVPGFDDNGGIWIKLTVNGITRLGYGDAPGKSGGLAVKEAIGDAIRNAAMRFGVALDLWKKELPAPVDDVPTRQVERVEQTEEEKKAEVRGQIALIARRQGRSVDDVAGDFATWSRGTGIRDASLALLVEYREHLQQPAQS